MPEALDTKPDNEFDNEIELLSVTDADTVDEICRFRAAVWLATPGVDPASFPTGAWRDRVDEVAQHWICRDTDGRLLASGRLAIHASITEMIEPHEYERFGVEVLGPIAAPDRVVVLPTAQGKGLASRILDRQDLAAKEAGAVCALRQASPRMARLLVRRGWRMHGPASIDSRFPQVQFTVASYSIAPDQVRIRSMRKVSAA